MSVRFRYCSSPVLGICYGHQILAHIFGGEVSTLSETVKDERLPLAWNPDSQDGIVSDDGTLQVFAEHQDYVSPPHQEIR